MLVAFLAMLLLSLPLTAFGAMCTWQDMSSGTSQEDYFILERRPGQTGTFTDIAHPAQDAQSFSDTQVTPGNEYCWRVKAVNATGSGAYSNTACLTIPPGSPPGVPQVACSYSDTTPSPSGLVLALSFNAGSGTTAADSSGANNSGTLNGPTWTNSGKYGKALLFDGVNDIVHVADSASLDLTTAMTLEAWVYPTVTVSGWKAILQKEVDAYLLSAGSDANVPALGGTFNGVCCTNVYAPAVLAINTWTHVAGTWDGTTERLYINGVQVASSAANGTLQVNANPVRIGGNTYGTEFFKGRIDEVRIYNRALTASEIITDKNTAIP